jgi:PAS domain S-box-containing protein
LSLAKKGETVPIASRTAAADSHKSTMAGSARIHVAIVAFCVLVIAILWIASILHMRAEREGDVADAVHRNANLAVALEEQTIRTLKGTNQALSFVKHEFERAGVKPVIQDLVDKGALDDSLFDRIEIANDRGIVAADRDSGESTNVAERDFFQYLRALNTNELYISKPSLEKSRWVLQLARRLNKPDGSFAGVVFANVNTAYFTRLYQRDELGEQGLITLIGRRDGIVRATRVGENGNFGQDLRSSQLLAEQARNPAGSFIGKDPTEGVERLYSYRTLREYPFIVAVGTSISETLAPFVEHARDYYAFAILSSVLIFIVGVGSMFAISHRRKAFNTLSRSESRYREIFTHTKDGVVLLDLEPAGQYRFADSNRAFQELSGHSNADVAGKRVEEVLPRDAADDITENVERCVARCASVSFSADLDFPAGHRSLWITLVPIRDDDGAIHRIMAVIRDRTENNRAASALRSADAANQAKTAFLATMSQEIRSPLHGVLGMFQLLARTPLDRDQVKLLEVVEESGKSLLRIVEDILDFSRIESGQLELNPQVTSIPKLVESVASLYSATATGRGLELAHYTDPRIGPAVVVDSLRLRQILSNFIGNAIKFTRHGRIDVKAELIEHGENDQVIGFSVTDTGIGISTEDQKGLFQPFRQGNAEGGDPQFGRTRMGLPICQRLATLMGGTVAVASEPGHGTTMMLTLRLKPVERRLLPHTASVHALNRSGDAAHAAEAPAPMPAAATDADDKPESLLLLVDGDAVNRLVLMRQVNMLGYSGELAENGRAALELWSTGRFALVITASDMAQMDGYELARTIRGRESADGKRRTPILACIQDIRAGEVEECLAAGMDDYVVRPVELGKLAEKLAQALAPSPERVRTANPIDHALLGEISAGDKALARDILQRFHRYNAEDTTLLTEAVRRADIDQLTYASLRIKGASKTVGAIALAGVCEDLERACRANDWETIARHMEEFMREVTRLNEFIESLDA